MVCGAFCFCVCKTSVHHYLLSETSLNNSGIVRGKATKKGFIFPKGISLLESLTSCVFQGNFQ